MNRAADALIRPTTADVPRHAVVNVCIAGICILTQQDGSGHNLSGLTIPALRDILSYPRLLQRTREVRRQPFDSHDFFARRTGQCRYTRTHRLAIKVYRAGATQCHATAELGSSELKFFPQHPQERRRGIDVELVFLPVDGERGHLTCDFGNLLLMRPIPLYHRTDNDMLWTGTFSRAHVENLVGCLPAILFARAIRS